MPYSIRLHRHPGPLLRSFLLAALVEFVAFGTALRAAVVPGEWIVRIDLAATGQASFSLSANGGSVRQEDSITVGVVGEAHYALEDVGGTLVSGELLRFTVTQSVGGGGTSTAKDASGFVATSSWSYVKHPEFGKDQPEFSGSISLSRDPVFNDCRVSPLFPAVEWTTSPVGTAPWIQALDIATRAVEKIGDLEFTSALPANRISWKSSRTKSASDASTAGGVSANGSATCTATVELKLLGPPEWEAVFYFTPGVVPSHANFLPVGGTNEIHPGNSLSVGVIVRASDGSKVVAPASKFTFVLRDVTREPGISMNFPHRALPANRTAGEYPYDLRLKELPGFLLDPERQQAVSTDKRNASGAVVECFDYGAYGKLEVKVETEDGQTFLAHREGFPGQTWLTIPLDDNGNQIADVWEKPAGSFTRKLPVNWEGTLDEKYKDQALAGDGISLYEKYRGFHVLQRSVKTVHERLDPHAKYVFVHNPDRLLSEVFNGPDGFPVSYPIATFCRVRYVGDSGWTGPGSFSDGKRVVNFNCSNDKHVVDQHAVYVTLNPSANPFNPADWIKLVRDRGFNNVAKYVGKGTFASCYPDVSAPGAFQAHLRPASTFQIDTYASGVDNYLRTSVRHHSQSLLPPLTAAEQVALVDNYIAGHWADYRRKYTLELAATLTHEMGHATGVQHHKPEEYSSGDPDLVSCSMRYYGPREFPPDLDDRFELKARKALPDMFCRKIFNCWGQLQITDNPNAKPGLGALAAPFGGAGLAGARPNLRLSSTPPEEEDTTLAFSTELAWPDLVAGDPLRLWVRLHGVTSLVAPNWTDGLKLELLAVDAAGNRRTVVTPAAWAGTLQPPGFDTTILAITNVTRIREWLAPAALAQLAAGKYVLELAWDGRNLAPESLLPVGGIVPLPAIEFEVRAPATDALLALHHRHLAWAAWAAGDDAGVREHAAEAARLAPDATDPLAMAVQFLGATSALRQGDAFGAARIVGDLQRRLPDDDSHLHELAATRFETLAPRVRVVELPDAANRPARLEIEGLTGSTYILQRSADLRAWTPVSTNTLPGLTAIVADATAPAGAERFYRVLWTR